MNNYRFYESTKHSEIGWAGIVPSHWGRKRLKSIFKIRKRIAGTLGFDVLSITQKGIRIKDIESGEGQLSMDYAKYQLVEPGDFAMNHMDLLTGYVDVSTFQGVTSPDYRVFTLEDTDSSSRYWLYVFQHCYKSKIFFPLGQGSAHLGRWRLPTEEFYEFKSPVPPLDEQEKIAQFLDVETAKIDTLIEKQQQLIALLKEKRQAVISHAVTKGLNPDAPMRDSGVEWLGEVPAHWEVVKLKHLVTSIEQGWSPQCDNVPADDSEPGVLKVGCVNGGVFRPTENKRLPDSLRPIAQYRLREGDLVISRANTKELVGSAAVVPNDYPNLYLCDKLYRLRVDVRLDPYLTAFFLGSSVVREQIELGASGASHSMQNIGQSTVLELSVPVIPDKELLGIKKYIDGETSKYGRLLALSEESIGLLTEKKAALISAAVTGKIDLRDWKPESDVAVA